VPNFGPWVSEGDEPARHPGRARRRRPPAVVSTAARRGSRPCLRQQAPSGTADPTPGRARSTSLAHRVGRHRTVACRAAAAPADRDRLRATSIRGRATHGRPAGATTARRCRTFAQRRRTLETARASTVSSHRPCEDLPGVGPPGTSRPRVRSAGQ
jgi:hypothetical protein